MTTALTHRVQVGAAGIARRLPTITGVLADPPSGSALKPVRGAFGPPVIGYTANIQTDFIGLARRQHDAFGPVSWIGAVNKRFVLALGPQAFDEVLTNREKTFANKGWEHLIAPFFERGVMLLDFDEHLRHRRVMQGAFGRQQLIGYSDLMNPAIERAMATWQPSHEFRMFDEAKRLALGVAGDVFLGSSVRKETDRLATAFAECVAGCQAIIRTDLPGGAWHRGIRARRLLEDWFREQIPEKRAGSGTDLFSQLCLAEGDDGERFTAEDIVNHMIFVLLAAHDTSTTTMSMMAHHLGQCGDWQDRARAESVALGKREIGYDDLDALPTLDLVMKETLRMWAPVGVQVREAVRDTVIQGHYIPAGTPVILGTHPTMRMEPWWSNPDTFDPDRFSEARSEHKSHRHAWMPFGAGVHKCIGMYFGGMEIKAVLHQMLLRYRWSVPADHQPPMNFGTGPLPADGLPIYLEPLGET